MRNLIIVLSVATAVFAGGCKTTAESPPLEDQPAQSSLVGGIEGTVTYMDYEGGFYGITTDDGGKYFPLNLGEEFREDGLRVRFTMRERNDVMTTTMWGRAVEITAMERL